jgi:hypothetical protein
VCRSPVDRGIENVVTHSFYADGCRFELLFMMVTFC